MQRTFKASWRRFGDRTVFYRSCWESNYGRYLEWLKQQRLIKEWEHEPELFWFDGIKRGCVTYLPDFKVINNDDSVEYHEVKGFMDSKSNTKLKRMKKYHPKVKVVLIDKNIYNDIKRKLSGVIKEWE